MHFACVQQRTQHLIKFYIWHLVTLNAKHPFLLKRSLNHSASHFFDFLMPSEGYSVVIQIIQLLCSLFGYCIMVSLLVFIVMMHCIHWCGYTTTQRRAFFLWSLPGGTHRGVGGQDPETKEWLALGLGPSGGWTSMGGWLSIFRIGNSWLPE